MNKNELIDEAQPHATESFKIVSYVIHLLLQYKYELQLLLIQ